MNVYRWIGAGRFRGVVSLVLATLLAAGCAGQKKSTTPPDAPTPPGGPLVPGGRPIVPGARPDAMDTSAKPAVNSPSILERRTEAYSKSMEAAITKHQASKPPGVLAPGDSAPGDAAPGGAAPLDSAVAVTPPADAQLAAAQFSSAPVKQPSQVQFLDPSAARLSLFPGGLEPAAVPQRLVPPAARDDSSQANVPASVDGIAQSSGRLPGDEPAVQNRAIQVAMIPPPPAGAVHDDVSVAANDSLEHRLEQRVRDYPHDLSAHLDYELSRFITDQPVPDLATMSALPSEDSEMLAAILDGLSNFRNNLRADANMLMSKKVAPLLDSAERLRSRAGLTIGTVCLCTEVKTFGVYTPFRGDPPSFTAGVKHPILVYVEVTNFSSEMTNDKQWQTDLPFALMLYSEQGMPEWKENRQSKPDTSRTRRRDFFFVQPATLQPNLPPGRHLLKITVEDTQAHRFAESTIPLNIEADAAAP